MSKLNLSSVGMLSWKSRLPDDVSSVVFDSDLSSDEDDFVKFAGEIEGVKIRFLKNSILGNTDLLLRMDRMRRIRLLSWIVSKTWPDVNIVLDLMSDDDSSDDDSSGDGGGRSKIAPLFKSDFEALSIVVKRRMVHGLKQSSNVDAVFGAIESFSSSEVQSVGGV